MSEPSSGTKPVSLYALLYVENGEIHVNLRSDSDALTVYLRCGALLANSLAAFGHSLKLVTNNSRLLRSRMDKEGIQLELIEMSFDRFVPETINFRSAHRKLDIIAAFGQGKMGPRPGLLDLDMVMLNPFPSMVLTDPCLVGYDIWHQIAPAYGADLVRRDIAAVSGFSANDLSHWWGGEFMVGPQDRFAQLSEVIETLYPRYLELARSLHHQGDEMILNAAMHVLDRGSCPIAVDGGTAGAVGRWWSAHTQSQIEPLNEFASRSILHLPSDKNLLSELFDDPAVSIDALYAHLRERLRAKTLIRRVLSPLQALMPGPSKYAPKL
jgi:hypothetical protein